MSAHACSACDVPISATMTSEIECVRVTKSVAWFRYDAACNGGLPVVVHGNRKLRDHPETSYSHLYTLLSKMNGTATVPAGDTTDS